MKQASCKKGEDAFCYVLKKKSPNGKASEGTSAARGNGSSLADVAGSGSVSSLFDRLLHNTAMPYYRSGRLRAAL